MQPLPEGAIRCLDHGFVRLIDHMGNDARIVQTARVSYGEGTKTVREDKALIAYLIENAHTSPLEQVVFTFHTKMPIFLARQHIRHRTARLNEISGRYSEMTDECYLPDVSRLRKQSTLNKQGSSDEVVDYADDYRDILRDGQEDAFIDYQKLLDGGVAKEIARINLPLSTYTEMYWQMDLHNLMHYIRLRIDSHAQEEIRVYAQAMLDLIRPIVPYAIEAYEEHVLGAVKFSRTEMEFLRNIVTSYIGEFDRDIFDDSMNFFENLKNSPRRQAELKKKLGVN